MATGPANLSLADLAHLQILRGVSFESIAGLLGLCTVRTLPAGEILLEKGQLHRTMYLLLSGSLSVFLEAGDEEPVAVLQPGVSVGELSVIDGRPASAGVVASAESRVLCVDDETFWRLVRASHEFAANLLMLMADRMRATNSTAQQFERASLVDGLTGLRNRRWLNERLPRLMERCGRDQQPICIAMIDVDHFKRLNDTHGHGVGDQVLCDMAEIITTCIRPVDFAARYGGEEFVAIFPNTPLDGARIATERLRQRIAQVVLSSPGDGRQLRITISAGVAIAHPDEPVDALFERADRALYEAKGGGRDRVCVGAG